MLAVRSVRSLPTSAATYQAPPPPTRLAPRDSATVIPAHIDIPTIGVAAPVDAVGLEGDGEMTVPADVSRTGWYQGLEAPGEVGTAVIVGHLDSDTGPGVFHRVPDLAPGDEIVVTLADATAVRYVVDRTEQYDKREFPTIAVYGPADRPSLRLITCGGSFDRELQHYSNNVVVYASIKEAT